MSRLDAARARLTPPKLDRPEPGWRRALRKYWPLGVAGGPRSAGTPPTACATAARAPSATSSAPSSRSDSPEFLRAAEALTGAPITTGNDAELLINGDRIFPAFLETIAARRANAERADLRLLARRDRARGGRGDLRQAREAGVECNVILDALGCGPDGTRA